MSRRWALAPAAALLVVPALAGCGSGGGDTGGTGGDVTTLRVFAAASLAGPFEELAEAFEDEHEGVEVELSLAGSADLVAQVQEGAPADVVATADTATLGALAEAGLLAGSPEVFATNTLQIAVPPDNPAGVSGLADLAGDVAVVVCAPAVPCGAAAQQVAARAGVTLRPVSEEQSVTDVLNKVASGEADAGLVYVTDVAAAGDSVLGIALPEAASVVNDYPVAAVADSTHPDLAAGFVDLVTGPQGRAALDEAGFGAP